MDKKLRSKQEINSSLYSLNTTYLHRRLNLNWFFTFFSLKTEFQDEKWTYVSMGVVFMILTPIFLYLVHFRLQEVILAFTDFTLLRLVELTAFLLFIYFSSLVIINYLSPILLIIRKYRITSIQYNNKKFTNGSKWNVSTLFLIVLIALKLYTPLSSHVPFLEILYWLIALFSIILSLFFPGYLWNGILNDLNEKSDRSEAEPEKSYIESYNSIISTNNSKYLFFLKRKIFISKNQDIVAYLSGQTFLDFILKMVSFLFLFVLMLIDSYFERFSYVFVWI